MVAPTSVNSQAMRRDGYINNMREGSTESGPRERHNK